MPRRKLKPCAYPGCHELSTEAYCKQHKRSNIPKRNSTKMGYNSRWRKERRLFLIQHPACARCGKMATVVDHVVPHKGSQTLFWDKKNWQPLCETCHNRKTRLEDMGGWKIP